MRLRRLNNIIHRDLGYFVVGTTVLYAISGLALNHLEDWDSNFVIQTRTVSMSLPKEVDSITRETVKETLRPLGEEENYRGHASPTPDKLKIYLDEGSILVDLEKGEAVHESVKRRPLFFQMNYLHLNPRAWWRVFSDFFAGALALVAITGLFVLKGRKGIRWRGAIFAGVGVLVPLLFLWLA